MHLKEYQQRTLAQVRNYLEHFDEDLDTWAADNSGRGSVEGNMPVAQQIQRPAMPRHRQRPPRPRPATVQPHYQDALCRNLFADLSDSGSRREDPLPVTQTIDHTVQGLGAFPAEAHILGLGKQLLDQGSPNKGLATLMGQFHGVAEVLTEQVDHEAWSRVPGDDLRPEVLQGPGPPCPG